jgi:hypothetical protein
MSHVWVKHDETDGTWQCPEGALAEFQKLGWRPCDPPEEVNPVTAERSAWLAEQAAAAEAAAKSEAKSGKNTKE